MKNNTSTFSLQLLLLLLISFGSYLSVEARQGVDPTKLKDCCIMSGGKMMVCSASVLAPMTKTMMLSNGTQVTIKGEYSTKTGATGVLKEGECIDMTGTLNNCAKAAPVPTTLMYYCPTHPAVVNTTGGKCSRCGTTMVLKK